MTNCSSDKCFLSLENIALSSHSFQSSSGGCMDISRFVHTFLHKWYSLLLSVDLGLQIWDLEESTLRCGSMIRKAYFPSRVLYFLRQQGDHRKEDQKRRTLEDPRLSHFCTHRSCMVLLHYLAAGVQFRVESKFRPCSPVVALGS